MVGIIGVSGLETYYYRDWDAVHFVLCITKRR